MNPANNQNQGFSGLGIAPILLEALAKLNYKNPTPIQQQAIPVAIQGKDLVGVAQTGTGKTLAFGIPMIQRLHGVKNRGLIVLCTSPGCETKHEHNPGKQIFRERSLFESELSIV